MKYDSSVGLFHDGKSDQDEGADTQLTDTTELLITVMGVKGW